MLNWASYKRNHSRICHLQSHTEMYWILFSSLFAIVWGQAKICCPTGECWTATPPYDHLPEPTGCANELINSMNLYTRNNRNNPQTVTRNSIPSQYVGSRSLTIFLIHGWNSDGGTSWIIDMKNSLLDVGDYNVIIVDWAPGASFASYAPSAANTRVVGHEAAMVANNLASNGGGAMGRTWCVGHSLGGHTCGQMGRRTSSRIARVTAMDPAGPGFNNVDNSISTEVGVDTTSANFVDVIHSDSAHDGVVRYGTHSALGHVDFYVEGGGTQPGCPNRRQPKNGQYYMVPPHPDQAGYCSHGKAHDYYVTSITNNCLRSTQTCSNINIMPGSCSGCGGNCPFMGYHTPTSARGTFWVDVSANAPFCP